MRFFSAVSVMAWVVCRPNLKSKFKTIRTFFILHSTFATARFSPPNPPSKPVVHLTNSICNPIHAKHLLDLALVVLDRVLLAAQVAVLLLRLLEHLQHALVDLRRGLRCFNRDS